MYRIPGLRKLGHHKQGWSLDKCKFTRTAVSLFSCFLPNGKKPFRSQYLHVRYLAADLQSCGSHWALTLSLNCECLARVNKQELLLAQPVCPQTQPRWGCLPGCLSTPSDPCLAQPLPHRATSFLPRQSSDGGAQLTRACSHHSARAYPQHHVLLEWHCASRPQSSRTPGKSLISLHLCFYLY